ncbi:ester cyclase [Kribbella sp. CA-293567]|uniref:ester cyclase n=1 Tax=Kribbella sp. CA-293567 TaxID=3002436 RepID=UPI0022DE8762|nr:ester cyclase [Kribbella sp. CA-293567]WBQ08216.1 ester cyclase [Kribbella sp. CA-293567]
MSSRDDRVDFYRRYLQRCNEYRFEELGEFVAEDVSGSVAGLDHYVTGLRAVVKAFPDYHWDLQHVLVDGDWLSARLISCRRHVDSVTGASRCGVSRWLDE